LKKYHQLYKANKLPEVNRSSITSVNSASKLLGTRRNQATPALRFKFNKTVPEVLISVRSISIGSFVSPFLHGTLTLVSTEGITAYDIDRPARNQLESARIEQLTANQAGT